MKNISIALVLALTLGLQSVVAYDSPDSLINNIYTAKNYENGYYNAKLDKATQEERIRIVYFYQNFLIKNWQLILGKYMLPEYDDKVYYEKTEDLAKQKDPLFPTTDHPYVVFSWGTRGAVHGNTVDFDSVESTDKYRRLVGLLKDFESISDLSKRFVTGVMDAEVSRYQILDKATAERMFAKKLYEEFLDLFTMTRGKDPVFNRYIGCNGAGLTYFMRGTHSNPTNNDRGVQTNDPEKMCDYTVINPDLERFKESYKNFLTGKNTYYKPVSVEVDPDYGNYINFYNIRENLPALVEQKLTLPDGYKDVKMPITTPSKTWGINVQEKYPSIFEKNNMIYNPHTKEVNNYIVAIFDPYGELIYAKYDKNDVLSRYYNKKDSCLSDDLSTRIPCPKIVNSSTLQTIYKDSNTLSNVPHYFSTYTGPKSSQEISTPTTEENVLGSLIGTEVYRGYTITKYNGIYYRSKDDLFNQDFIVNHLKPFLEKNNISQEEFMKDTEIKEGLIKTNFDRRGLTNLQRTTILEKLNKNSVLYKYVYKYRDTKYNVDPVRYANSYKLYLQVYYITNYMRKLYNYDESPEYKAFGAKFVKE